MAEMSPLRRRFIEEMRSEICVASTQRCYVHAGEQVQPIFKRSRTGWAWRRSSIQGTRLARRLGRIHTKRSAPCAFVRRHARALGDCRAHPLCCASCGI